VKVCPQKITQSDRIIPNEVEATSLNPSLIRTCKKKKIRISQSLTRGWWLSSVFFCILNYNGCRLGGSDWSFLCWWFSVLGVGWYLNGSEFLCLGFFCILEGSGLGGGCLGDFCYTVGVMVL
jgi:hypothetical protein